MNTKVLTDKDKDLNIAADYLKSGKTVVFPTETVYGLGANALDEKAVKKIFEAKGRPSDNPLIIHISSLDMLEDIAEEISDTAKLLIDKYWPGPLTLIFKKNRNVPKSVTAGLSTVAVRFPSNNIAYELIEKAGIPIAAPSANLSGKPSPTRFSHAFEDLNGRVDAIIESEPCEVGVESTVLDVSGETPVLLRPGMVTLEELKELVGEVRLGAFEASSSDAPMSPGMKYKHYAPKADVIILKGSIERIKDYVQGEKDRRLESDNPNPSREKKLAILNFKENISEFEDICMAVSLGSINNPDEVTANLFKCLRELDELGADIIYAPEIPDIGKWRAVQNRLYKSAGGNIIDLAELLEKESTLNENEEVEKIADDTEELKSEDSEKIAIEEFESEESAEHKTDSQKIKEVLFICTGNTCRSPMAEGIFNSLAGKSGTNARAVSAGTYAYNNLPVSENSVKAMNEKGIDISRHRSRQITREMLNDADIVLVMTEEHTEFLNAVVPELSAKIMTVAKYIDLDISVDDPYGEDLEEYRRCRDQLEKIIKLIFMQMKKAQKD